MSPYAFSVLFFGFSTFLIGVFIWLKRGDFAGKIYFIFSVFVAGWGIGFGVMANDYTPYSTALLSARVSNVSAVIFPAFWYHFTACYAGLNIKKKNVIIGVYAVSFALASTGASDIFIPFVKSTPWQSAHPHPGVAYHFFPVLFLAVSFLGFLNLMHKYRSSKSNDEKNNVCGFMWATGTGFLGGSLTFFPVYDIHFPPYNLFLMPIYPFVMAYFMTRLNLLSEVEIAHAAHKDKLATIGTLATSVNHEIKNPLYVIKGLAESFKQNYNDGVYADNEDVMKQAYEIMQKAETQTERALEIMRNFSGFAKQGVSEQPSFKTVNLAEVLDKIIPLVSYELKLDQISIKNAISDTSINVQADERYLEEILFNLIMNSCQAMKQTGGELTLSAKEVNDKVLIEIKDNGPGITKEAQKQIFEPFYTTKEEGTGLGLYITKQLVEKIGGKITIDSTENQGAIFRLELNKA